MNENEIRSRLRRAIAESEYPPALTAGVTARLKQPPAASHSRWLGVVAGLLAASIVLGLVYVRAHSVSQHPVSKPTPASHLPGFVLDATHLTAAASYVTDPHLQRTIRGRTVALVGMYADMTNTTLIFHASPDPDTGLGIGVWSPYGPMHPLIQMTVLGDGYQYFQQWQAPFAGPDHPANLDVSIIDPYDPHLFDATSARRSFGDWSFSIDLPVQASARLPMRPIPTYIGSWKVTNVLFELTPSSIRFQALIIGASCNTDYFRAITLTLADGSQFLGGGGGCGGFGPQHASFLWFRPARATSAVFRITAPGGQYSTPVSIPAPGVMPSSALAPAPTPTPGGQIPDALIDQLGLTAAVPFISRPNLTQTDGGRSLKLIAAYADPWRTVLIFNIPPPQVALVVHVFDDAGQITNGNSLLDQIGPGENGYASLFQPRGPHAGANGMAHIRVEVAGYELPLAASGERAITRAWNFAFDLKVQPATPLKLNPALTSVGSWTVTVEHFDLTPSVIYLQVVVVGIQNGDPRFGAIDAFNLSGASLLPYSSAEAIPNATRFRFQWARPAVAATLQLIVTARGGTYSADVKVPAPPKG